MTKNVVKTVLLLSALLLALVCMMSCNGKSPSVPSDVNADFFELTWEGVPDATEYAVKISGKEYTTKDTSFSLFDHILPGERRSIGVKAVFSDGGSSEWVSVDYTAESVTEGLEYGTDNVGRYFVYCPSDKIPQNGELVLPDEYLGNTLAVFGKPAISISGGASYVVSESESESVYKGEDFSAIKKIRLPKGLEIVSCGALYSSQVEEVCIPFGVTDIYASAFEGCKALSKINIPDSVNEIGSYAFFGCESLEDIYIPSSVKNIEAGTFSKTGLKSVTLHDNLRSIGSFAFYDCNALCSITFPDVMPHTNLKAFHNTSWYDSLPDGVVYISDMLYSYKGEMPENTELIIPEKITKMANSFVFKDQVNLKSIVFKSGIPMIHMETFAGCTSLSEIVLCNGLSLIYEGAFYKCTSLKEIDLPETVTRIDDGAFSYSALEDFVAPKSLASINYPGDKRGSFEGCVDLKKVILSSNVKRIEDNTFKGCESLESIILPDTLETFGDLAFVDCKLLTEINLPDSIKHFSFAAFAGTGIRSIILPVNLKKYYNYCMNLDWKYASGVEIEYIIIKKETKFVDIITMYLSPKLDAFYYEGTKDDFKNVDINTEYITTEYVSDYVRKKINEEVAKFMKELTVYFYNETEPAESGNYWHYINGVPTVW